MLLFKYKDETMCFYGMYDEDSRYIKHIKIEVEDIESGTKKVMQVHPDQIKSAEIASVKGLETFVGDIIYKTDCFLREKVGFFNLIGWDKEIEWYWAVDYAESPDNRDEVVIDLEKNQEKEIAVEFFSGSSDSLSRIEFSYFEKCSSRKSGKKRVDEVVSLDRLGLKERMFTVFKLDEITKELKRVSNEEATEGQKAFLSAIGRLPPNHDINLLNDIAKAKLSKRISKNYEHRITNTGDAYEIVSKINLFVNVPNSYNSDDMLGVTKDLSGY